MANGPYEFISTFQTDPFEEQRLAAERQRRMAELLAQQSEQFGQYQTPRGPLGEVRYPISQGLAQLATAIGGAFKRGRAEREEEALRERERAAREEFSNLFSGVLSPSYNPVDPTVSDTALPGEVPSAQDMSISQRLMAGLPGISEEARALAAPTIQQLRLSEAMSEQERQRELEDFAAQRAIELQFAAPPEWNTVNVREGNEQVTYAIDPTNPANRMELGRGAAFSPNQMTRGGGGNGAGTIDVPVSIMGKDYAANERASQAATVAQPTLMALERTINILENPNFAGTNIFSPERETWNRIAGFFGDEQANQIATDLGLLRATGSIVGIGTLSQIGGSDTERELEVATRTGFNPRGTNEENLALARQKYAAAKFIQEYPLLQSEWMGLWGSLFPAYRDDRGRSFADFAAENWERIKNETGANVSVESGNNETGAGASAESGNNVLNEARDAIARGADRNQVIQRLEALGVDPSGL